jgi:protein gp37
VTSIEWTRGEDGSEGRTWNPIRGCSRTSPGCGGGTKGPLKGGCYAEAIAERFSGPGQPFEGFAERGKGWTRKVALVPEKLAEPLSWRKPGRVFANSMSDLFHEELSNEDIAAVFGVMAAAPHLTFQVLTKRAQRMHDWFRWIASESPWNRCIHAASAAIHEDPPRRFAEESIGPFGGAWPLPNVHLGVSVEDQKRAEERIPFLLDTPAAVRWLSLEPQLGLIDLTRVDAFKPPRWPTSLPGEVKTYLDVLRGEGLRPSWTGVSVETHVDARIAWVVQGGESGHGARPFDLAWARSIRDQCARAEVPYFFKQAGARPSEASGLSMTFVSFEQWSDKARSWLRSGRWTLVDARGRVCVDGADMMRSRDEGAFPVVASPLLKLKSKKGGDLSELPKDLRVREMPEVSL